MSNKSNVSGFFQIMIFGYIVIVPLLTMRSFADERKSRTEQLLLTAPVSIWSMVFGKFLASFLMFGGAVVFTSLYALVLIPYAKLQLAILIGNMLALLFVGAVFIAVGLFVSSLTENQLAAAVGTIDRKSVV